MKPAEGEVREKDNRFYAVADLASARNFNNKWEKSGRESLRKGKVHGCGLIHTYNTFSPREVWNWRKFNVTFTFFP